MYKLVAKLVNLWWINCAGGLFVYVYVVFHMTTQILTQMYCFILFVIYIIQPFLWSGCMYSFFFFFHFYFFTSHSIVNSKFKGMFLFLIGEYCLQMLQMQVNCSDLLDYSQRQSTVGYIFGQSLQNIIQSEIVISSYLAQLQSQLVSFYSTSCTCYEELLLLQPFFNVSVSSLLSIYCYKIQLAITLHLIVFLLSKLLKQLTFDSILIIKVA